MEQTQSEEINEELPHFELGTDINSVIQNLFMSDLGVNESQARTDELVSRFYSYENIYIKIDSYEYFKFMSREIVKFFNMHVFI